MSLNLCAGGCFLDWTDFEAWDADIADVVLRRLLVDSDYRFNAVYIKDEAVVHVLVNDERKMVAVWPSDIACDDLPVFMVGRLSDGTIKTRG